MLRRSVEVILFMLLLVIVPGATEAASTTANTSQPSLLSQISYSGSIFLYGYYPQMPGVEPSFDLYAFEFNFDTANADHTLGIHSQIRVRDDKLRSFYNSNIWFQELYLYKKTNWGQFDVGKMYRRVGLF